MKRLLTLLVAATVVLCGTGVWAANSVVVESRTMGTGAVDCPIHVYIDNDFELNGVVVPLVIREVTPGAFITALKLSWGGRLPAGSGNPLWDIRIVNQFAEPDGTCSPEGFATQTWGDTLKHPVASSPEGAVFAAIKIIGPSLPPGADLSGSLVLTLDVGGTAGTFEIDSTCTDPQNHLQYLDVVGTLHVPSFSKGIVTVEANSPPVAVCQNVAVPAGAGCQAMASVDGGSYDPDGGPVTVTQEPPGPYPLGQTIVTLIVADANCTADTCQGIVTVEDLTPPVVTCPPDTIVSVPQGEPGSIVEFGATATDECGAATVVCNPPSGTFFPLGISTVTCVATDAAQNADTCSFLIAVGTSGGYCNDRPEDVNCDGQVDIFDMNQVIDVTFGIQPESGRCCHLKK
jgi:hypothetical protein